MSLAPQKVLLSFPGKIKPSSSAALRLGRSDSQGASRPPNLPPGKKITQQLNLLEKDLQKTKRC